MKAVNIKWYAGDIEMLNDEEKRAFAETPTEIEIPDCLGDDKKKIYAWLSKQYEYCLCDFELKEELEQRIKRVNKTWCEDDIAAALRYWDVPATKENMKKVADPVFLKSFRRALIETGNDFLRDQVSCIFGDKAK